MSSGELNCTVCLLLEKFFNFMIIQYHRPHLMLHGILSFNLVEAQNMNNEPWSRNMNKSPHTLMMKVPARIIDVIITKNAFLC